MGHPFLEGNALGTRLIFGLKERRKTLPRETVRIFIVLLISMVHTLFKFSALHHACLKSIPFLYFSRDHLRVDNGDNLRSILGIICDTVQLHTCRTCSTWTCVSLARPLLSFAHYFQTPATQLPTCSRGASRNARLEIELTSNITPAANSCHLQVSAE